MSAGPDAFFPAHLADVRRRTDQALSANGFDELVVHAGRLAYNFLDDSALPFRVNPHFKHWAPLTDAPDSFMHYRPGHRPRLFFHQPADYWHKPPELPREPWLAEFDLTILREPGAARASIPGQGTRCAFIGEAASQFGDWGFAALNPAPLLAHLHYDRAVKTPYELACMREASRLAAKGHLAAQRAFFDGASEYGAHQAYLLAMGHTEGELPYGNIVAFNEAAAILHYQTPARVHDQPRRSFLIDAGAQFRGYASDITRTYSAQPGEFQELVERMDAVQQQLCAAVRAGTSYIDVHLLAHRLIAGVLHEAGIITVDADAAVSSGLSSVFFPHGIGHLLGLQVHDVAGLAKDPQGGEIPRPPGHPYLRLTRTLEPGFVVTIEPGLYFIDLLLDEARKGAHGRSIDWNAVERLRPFGGIRIEDDVACTAGAPENLTRDAFAAISAAA
jgi:Xaa-Pro dipeptidase